jgi:hypothetical protein
MTTAHNQRPPFPERKISETFLDFASPLLDVLPHGVGKAEFESVLKIAFTVWNAVVYADVTGDEKHLETIRKLTAQDPDPIALPLIKQLIDRKRAVFGADHRLIGEYRVTAKWGGFNLWAEARTPYPKT